MQPESQKEKKWDMPINLEIPKEEYAKKIGKGGIYTMTREECQELKEWIEDRTAKGYICPSCSEIAASVFFIPNKGGKKHLVQNYHNSTNGSKRTPIQSH